MIRAAERWLLRAVLFACLRVGIFAEWLTPRIARRLRKIGGEP